MKHETDETVVKAIVRVMIFMIWNGIKAKSECEEIMQTYMRSQ